MKPCETAQATVESTGPCEHPKRQEAQRGSFSRRGDCLRSLILGRCGSLHSLGGLEGTQLAIRANEQVSSSGVCGEVTREEEKEGLAQDGPLTAS